MKKIIFLLPCVVIGVFFWGCIEETPMQISQFELDEPNSRPAISESNYTDGVDFSEGYYNGKIRSDQVKLEWEASADTNFLTYKIFRALGGGPVVEDINEGFEGGSLPSGWTEYGDCGGWDVTNNVDIVYEGNYSIQSNPDFCFYGYDYLEKTITVPQNEYIFISFLAAGYSVYGGYGEGRLKINGLTYDYWSSNYWQNYSYSYYTGSNTEITLQWRWYSDYYTIGLLDNIEISGVEGGSLGYSLIETLNEKNAASFWDTTLTQNQYYSYKVATIVEQGTHKVDDIEIKTPLWQVPSNIEYAILSPEVVEVIWDDNSESETSFTVYVEKYDYDSWGGYGWYYSNQDDTSMVISNLSIDTQYRLGVKAYNSWEETDTSYSGSFEINFDPPTNLNTSQASNTESVYLTWDDNTNLENGFEIERDTGSKSGFELLTILNANTTSYMDTDTTNFEYGDEITYRVRAYNDYSGTVYTDYSNDASVILSETTFLFEGFEDGILPNGWSQWTSGGGNGWSISSNYAYEGNYSIHGGGGYYDNEYLEVTINVPQFTSVDISFYQYEVDTSGDGDLYINGNYHFDWDSSSGWYQKSTTYYTGSNSQITLLWTYTTGAYGDVYLDNIQVTW